VESTLSPSKAAAAIWSQVAKVDQANLTPDAARAILELEFDPEDRQRVDELSVKAQKGALTPQEGADLDESIRVAGELAILQSKARLLLKRTKQSR